MIPTFERAASIESSIGSVLANDYDDLELLVIDDASTDETCELVRSIDDQRVRLVALTENVGGAEARNRGLRLATGEVIAFQDSDDLWTNDHLELLLAALDEGGACTGVAYGQMRHAGSAPYPSGARTDLAGDVRSLLTRHNVVGLPASVIRRSALAVGFDATLPRLQDWDLFLGVARQWQFAFVEHPVLEVGLGQDRISDNDDNYYVALRRILDRHDDTFRLEPQHRAAFHMQLVRHDLRNRQLAEAARGLRSAAEVPGAFGRWAVNRLFRGSSPVARGDCG